MMDEKISPAMERSEPVSRKADTSIPPTLARTLAETMQSFCESCDPVEVYDCMADPVHCVCC